MPVDHQHAFASGLTYPVRVGQRHGLRWMARGLARLNRYLVALTASQAAATFAANAIVGANCRVGPNALCVNSGARPNIRLGEHVICRGILRTETFRPGRIVVGDYVYIGDDSILSCAYQIEIGSWAMLAHGVQVFDNDAHPLDQDMRQKDYLQAVQAMPGERYTIEGSPIRIGAHAWIGFNSIVLKGVQIGEGGIVGAGSVVVHDVPAYTIVAGNPARPVTKLNNDL